MMIKVTVAAAIAVVGTIASVCALWPILPWAVEAVSLRSRLLCKTDHQALLEACQEISKQVTSGRLQAGKYQIRPWRDAAVSQFPQVIRTLRPTYVFIDDKGRVMVEMFGGLGHFGVYAYPEGYKEPGTGFKYGHRQLIPNLWYYDDEYDRNPEFDKTVGSILEKRGKTGTGGVSP